MKFRRHVSLYAVVVCLSVFPCAFLVISQPAFAQQPQQTQQQTPPPAQQPPPQKKQGANPFEAIPQAEEAKPVVQSAKPLPAVVAGQPAPATAVEDVIEAIEFRGARRVPQDTLKAMIFTKMGDKCGCDTCRPT